MLHFVHIVRYWDKQLQTRCQLFSIKPLKYKAPGYTFNLKLLYPRGALYLGIKFTITSQKKSEIFFSASCRYLMKMHRIPNEIVQIFKNLDKNSIFKMISYRL